MYTHPQIKIGIIFFLLLLSMRAQATCLGLGCTCSVAATPVSFGSYNPLGGAVNSTGNVSITCSALILGLLISYDIQLSKGNSSSYSPRTLLSGGDILNYNLYVDSARTQIWGDTTGGSVQVSDNYLLDISPTTRNYTAYGQIPANQTSVVVGSYSDSITATVIF